VDDRCFETYSLPLLFSFSSFGFQLSLASAGKAALLQQLPTVQGEKRKNRQYKGKERKPFQDAF
jgi:hypothetical protein